MDSHADPNDRLNNDDPVTPAGEQHQLIPDPGQHTTTFITLIKTLERKQKPDNLTTGTATAGSGAGITAPSAGTTTETPSSSSSPSPIIIIPTCYTCLPFPTDTSTTAASPFPSALTASCATVHWTLIRLSTAYLWVPVAGCSGSHPECCVYSVAALPIITTTVTESGENGGPPTATVTRTAIWDVMSEDVPFPTAASATTLEACPADYETVTATGGGTGRGCCPKGFTPAGPWGSVQTPCASRFYSSVTPPPVPASSLPSIGHTPVVETVINHVFALEYALAPEPKRDAVTTAKKAGIWIGSGLAGILFGMLVGWGFVRKWRLNRTERTRPRKGAAAANGKGVLAGLQIDGKDDVYRAKGKAANRSLPETKAYPIYPPADAASWYASTTAEISPVSPVSPGSGTGSGTGSWGIGKQPPWAMHAAGGSSGLGDMGQQTTEFYGGSPRIY